MTQCPKCKNTMIDEGVLDGYAGNMYKLNKFRGWKKTFTRIPQKMFVCLNCGYGELFVDPELLRKKLDS